MLSDAGVLVGALFLSVLHSIMPNHWGPFVLVGNLRKWSKPKLMAITFGAAFLHSSVTLAIGLAIAYAGHTAQQVNLHSMESIAAWVLILLGLTLILGRLFNRHLHGHFEPSRVSTATDALLVSALVGMLSLSPCAEILPLYLLAASASWNLVLLLSVVLLFATTIGMTLVVVCVGDKLSRIRWKIIEENEGLLAGTVLLALGGFAAAHSRMEFIPEIQFVARFGLETLVGAWSIFLDAAPYILFGCLMGGLIYIFIKPERVVRYLGKGRYKPVINAALFGIPLPLCSCGVIPTAISLRRMGATRGATSAFLITTPETGVDSIAVTYALLDPIYTVFRPVAAFLTGVTAGVLEVLFGVKDDNRDAEKKQTGECPSCHAEPGDSHAESARAAGPAPAGTAFFQKLKQAVSYGLGDFLDDISLWLVIGFLAAGLILTAVPPDAVEQTLGGGLSSMLLMLVVSIPLYICASATTPMAAALLLKGASPGVALVLLLAGPASNTAGIVMLTKFLGKRSVLIYLTSIIACSLGFGLLLNQIYDGFGLDPKATIGVHHADGPGDFKIFCALTLATLVAFHLCRQAFRHLVHRHEPTPAQGGS